MNSIVKILIAHFRRHLELEKDLLKWIVLYLFWIGILTLAYKYYLDFFWIDPFTKITSEIVSNFANVLGFSNQIYYGDIKACGILHNSKTSFISIYAGCSGVKNILQVFSFILSFPYKRTINWAIIAACIGIIFCSNILRNLFLFFVSYYFEDMYSSIKSFTGMVNHLGLVLSLALCFWSLEKNSLQAALDDPGIWSKHVTSIVLLEGESLS